MDYLVEYDMYNGGCMMMIVPLSASDASLCEKKKTSTATTILIR